MHQSKRVKEGTTTLHRTFLRHYTRRGPQTSQFFTKLHRNLCPWSGCNQRFLTLLPQRCDIPLRMPQHDRIHPRRCREWIRLHDETPMLPATFRKIYINSLKFRCQEVERGRLRVLTARPLLRSQLPRPLHAMAEGKRREWRLSTAQWGLGRVHAKMPEDG